MSVRAKVAVVLMGYVVAFLVALGGTMLYIRATSGPDRDLYGAMYEFGDSLLFLGLFGLSSVPATCAGLYFLRPVRAIWVGLSVGSLALALTALVSCIVYLMARPGAPDSLTGLGSALVVLRLLVAPLFALGFLLAAVFAPSRMARFSLGAAMLIEAVSFGGLALNLWLGPAFQHG